MDSAKRLAYLALGFLSLGLGILGAFLPLLPTTVFVLIAAWAFARSSERFHAMLLEHRLFGPIVTRWEQDRSLTRQTKRVATLSIAVAFSVSIVFVRDRLWLVVFLMLMMAVLTTYIWTRNESGSTSG